MDTLCYGKVRDTERELVLAFRAPSHARARTNLARRDLGDL